MTSDKKQTKQRTVQKYDLNAADDLFGTLLTDDTAGDDYDLDGLLDDTGQEAAYQAEEYDQYDSGAQQEEYSDLTADDYSPEAPAEDFVGETAYAEGGEEKLDEGAAESGVAVEEATEAAAPLLQEIKEGPAVVNFIGGMRQEVSRAKLFYPEDNTIQLMDEETGDELIVFLEQLESVHLAAPEAGVSGPGMDSLPEELIETVEGTTYQACILPRQERNDLLCCLAADDQARFPIILFPRASIRSRRRNKALRDILLERRFVSRTILQQAVHDFEQAKKMTVEQVLSQKARILLADIKQALESAGMMMQGLGIAETLLISGIASEEQILDALKLHEHYQHLSIGQFLVEKGFVKDTELCLCLADKYRIPFIDLRQRKIPRESLSLLPKSMIVQNGILPLVKKDDILLVATPIVDMSHLSEAIVRAGRCKAVKYVLSPASQIQKIITSVFGAKE